MSKKHMWSMLACCFIGLGAVLAVFLFGIPVSNVVIVLLLLLCPLSHLLMMKYVDHGQDVHHENHEHSPKLHSTIEKNVNNR